MIKINNISKVFNGEFLFENISFNIKENDKIAIVGNNGVGKTTLLKCILDDNYITSGTIEKDKGSVGYLSQNVIEDLKNTVREEYDNIFKELKNINIKMQKILSKHEPSESDLKIYGDLENNYMQLGGYEQQSKIEVMMSKFGFNKDDLDKVIGNFSGGQITKLSLIKLLLITPDYLFLDEPTNHLDIETISWLENYLADYSGSVIVISHDRYFLDKVAKKIIDIENKEIEIYNTNYTNYMYEKKLRYDLKLATYERQQKEIKEYEEFIDRFRGKPSKIGQVNDRKKKIERMEIVKKPVKIKEEVNFKIDGLNIKKAYYIDVIDADIGYDKNNVLIKNLNFKLLGGEKIAIIGANGIGKTTLLKTILKQIPSLSGNVKLHHTINIGYFEQVQNNLDPEITIYDILKGYMPERSTTYIRSFLAKFLFKREDVYKKISMLSGGERVRITLAIFSLEKYDMIVLDEPTNHLDYETKQILEKAIKEYQGSVVCVSHDRYFLNEIVEHFIFLQKGSYTLFNGKYTEYEKYLLSEKSEKIKKKVNNKKEKKASIKEYNKLEKSIENLENKKDEYFKLSMEETYYNDYEKLNELNLMIKEVEDELKRKYIEFEKLIEGE